MVRKIFIYTAEEVKRLSPKIKFPVNEERKPTKPDPETTANNEERSSVIIPGY